VVRSFQSLSPRLLNREGAAAYIGVSANTFDDLVKEGKMPKPKQLSTRRHGYDVRELDAAVDRLPTAGVADRHHVDDDVCLPDEGWGN
jgi:predicted DNA-binding transcriptional regulator AlpA